ncbi:MAG TPA: hypothetical protein VIY49_04760 [Bryobacteraceae bacterium]
MHGAKSLSQNGARQTERKNRGTRQKSGRKHNWKKVEEAERDKWKGPPVGERDDDDRGGSGGQSGYAVRLVP